MTSNFRVEHINFYVADFNTAYHAILGRPALAKFMAMPHYAYLVLKMPSHARVLALWANLTIAYACETKSLTLAEATDLSIQMASVVTEAKSVPTKDMEIPELEPPWASDLCWMSLLVIITSTSSSKSFMTLSNVPKQDNIIR